MRVVLISKAMTVAATHSKAELLGQSMNMTLITPDRWPGYVPEAIARPRNFQHRTLRVVLNGHNHFHYYRGLGALLQSLRPDLVHIDEEPYSLVTTQALRVARRMGARAISFTWQNIRKTYPPPFSWMERYVYRAADAIVCGNQEAVEVLRSKGFAGPTPVIPQFGVDMPAISEFPVTSRSGGYTIAYAGRLVSEKGLDVLLQALARVLDVRLLLVGTGPEREALERLTAHLGLADRVTFLGGLPSTQMTAFFQSVDVLVLPSLTRSNWKEQFGRVLIEAMASGAAVIGSNSGEIPSVIGDAGLVVAEGDAAALALAIERLRDDDFRNEMRRRGKERALSFTQQRIADATLDVYRQVLGQPPVPARI
ncbi:glycosyltransferase family 1 protein [Stagnimonas aquatica]|uniref:Glycosyltransferase family 1 protein n=1 Tax=Stagnimonas aquatica TaxID=2689987 RepID=A0A3N0V940_9GAMM|nr:glycosyltransferase family 4 protein [Stagnimonas aquatica]ROH89152.1 glycosyltransferase family 1 protein [Stagnimonas aquatica]